MKLKAKENIILEGTNKVILELEESALQQLKETSKESSFVRLQHKGITCGAIIDQIRFGSENILMDKYIRSFLKVREGDEVEIILTEKKFTEASDISILVSSNWKSPRGEKIIKEYIYNKPLCKGQKFPIFTLSGDIVEIEVLTTIPEGIVVPSKDTTLNLPTEKEKDIGRLISWPDIGGLGNEVIQIRELIEYPLLFQDVFSHVGIEPPRGIILYGPPGTGKTLIARALTNEVGANFYLIRGPEIMSGTYGESEKALRDIFNKAKKNAPSIILIDELDSLAPGREQTRGELEHRIVSTFLTELDGLVEYRGIIVIGTTNRLKAIDPALRRAGRLEYEIHIGVPNFEGRLEILRIHTRRMPLNDDVNLDEIAKRTYGFVGADITSLAREAAYSALRHFLNLNKLVEKKIVLPDEVKTLKINQKDFETALSRIKPSAMREVMVETPRNVSFEDIGGLEEVKNLLSENIINGIRKRKDFDAIGAKPAKGILFYGASGTGKTLIARAIANECEANFLWVRGPEIRSKWFGESEEKIRFIFAKAREVAPCIVLFDEIDALAATRGRDVSGTTDSIVNQILAEMDAIEGTEGIFVIATTNMKELIDPAFLRPGRFDYQIEFTIPNKKGREEIFKIHLRQTRLDEDVSINELARITDGHSGAEIAEICRLAKLYTLRKIWREKLPARKAKVSMEQFQKAIKEVGETNKKLKQRRIGFIRENDKKQ